MPADPNALQNAKTAVEGIQIGGKAIDVHEVLGSGDDGVVVKAQWGEEIVAVKLSANAKLLQAEFDVGMRVQNCPHVLKPLGFGKVNNFESPYEGIMIMPLYNGGSLQDFYEKHKHSIPPLVMNMLVEQIREIPVKIDEIGLYHNDISCRNLLIEFTHSETEEVLTQEQVENLSIDDIANGKVKMNIYLTDFGRAAILKNGGPKPEKSMQLRSALGPYVQNINRNHAPIWWISSEVLRNPNQLHPSADRFGAEASIIELQSGGAMMGCLGDGPFVYAELLKANGNEFILEKIRAKCELPPATLNPPQDPPDYHTFVGEPPSSPSGRGILSSFKEKVSGLRTSLTEDMRILMRTLHQPEEILPTWDSKEYKKV